MQSTTGGEVGGGTSTDTSILEAEVRNTVVQGSNVQKDVHNLTIRALRKHHRDHESLRHVISAVLKGAREGAEQKLQQTPVHTQMVLKSIRDAVAGLDAALAQLAQASKLALEEAAGRAQKFSNEELTRMRKDLESTESLFLEILLSSASTTQKVVSETLHDLATHAKRNGTAVGSQLKDTLKTFNQQITSVGHEQFEAGIDLARAITNLMREAAAEALNSIAERVKPDDKLKRY
jgi:DNA repair exonuclease SbcCD nuclease subunit